MKIIFLTKYFLVLTYILTITGCGHDPIDFYSLSKIDAHSHIYTKSPLIMELAKKNNIKMIFSHRSGETMEDILADVAFGFQADFIKCGITGDVREAKIKRMIQIEKSLK